MRNKKFHSVRFVSDLAHEFDIASKKKLTPEQIKQRSLAKWRAQKAEAALTPQQRAARKRIQDERVMRADLKAIRVMDKYYASQKTALDLLCAAIETGRIRY